MEGYLYIYAAAFVIILLLIIAFAAAVAFARKPISCASIARDYGVSEKSYGDLAFSSSDSRAERLRKSVLRGVWESGECSKNPEDKVTLI
jgi:hypothetical protein